MHARVLTPPMFMAQDPQIPSRQDRRKVRVGSCSFLILTKASNTIGPTAFKSRVYSCKVKSNVTLNARYKVGIRIPGTQYQKNLKTRLFTSPAQWGSEIQPFKIQNYLKSNFFGSRFSNGWTFARL